MLVDAYLRMSCAAISGKAFNKAAIRRALIAAGLDRSHGSIEAKFMNCSAAMADLGYAQLMVPGYKPAPNYQAALRIEISEQLSESFAGLMQVCADRPSAYLVA